MENVETQLEDVEAIVVEWYDSEMKALHPQDAEDCTNKLENLLRINCEQRDNSTQTESEFAEKGVATMLEYAGEEHVKAVKSWLAIGTPSVGKATVRQKTTWRDGWGCRTHGCRADPG